MLQYRVIVVQLPDGNFEAYVRAFPSLHIVRPSATEAVDGARVEMTRLLDEHAKSGRHPPPPDREAVMIELVAVPFEARAGYRPTVQVELVTGRVLKDGEELSIRGTALALLVSLAAENRDMSIDALSERLYPGVPGDQAYAALKMAVYRVRKQLGVRGAIETTEHGYRLADDDVVVDTRFLPQVVRAIRTRSVPKAIESRLDAIFEHLTAGRPAVYGAWEWFAPIERNLRLAATEIGLYLANRALREDDSQRALEIAAALESLDPLDESACELEIRVHLARGDRDSARQAYRRYAAGLQELHGMEPSPALRSLVETVTF